MPCIFSNAVCHSGWLISSWVLWQSVCPDTVQYTCIEGLLPFTELPHCRTLKEHNSHHISVLQGCILHGMCANVVLELWSEVVGQALCLLLPLTPSPSLYKYETKLWHLPLKNLLSSKWNRYVKCCDKGCYRNKIGAFMCLALDSALFWERIRAFELGKNKSLYKEVKAREML